MTVMPKTAYQQGIPKHFTKFDKFEYFWPSFANIGEQPILNKELYVKILLTVLHKLEIPGSMDMYLLHHQTSLLLIMLLATLLKVVLRKL